jgi:rhamnosyltransferase
MVFPNSRNICAVLVTYHPDLGFEERVQKLLAQVRGVVIVDNHSNPEALCQLREISERAGATLIENAENRGVAAALNQGVLQAKAQGFTWVITFDQDSLAAPDLIENMIHVCTGLGEQELARVGILGTNHVDLNSQRVYVRTGKGHNGWIERKTVITSGSLFSIATYDDIGPFREDFFIDSVDHEYCLRARARGYRVLLTLEPLLVHSMGNRKLKRVLPGVAVETVNYAPFRWYFMVRNRLTVVKEYARREPIWALARAARLAIQCATTLALETNRLEKARCIGLGAIDFATKRRARLLSDLIGTSG